MSKPTQIAADRLKSFIERIEKLEEEKKAVAEDIKDVYTEAKAIGFDVKVMREVIKQRKKDSADLEEFETLLDVYKNALGMLFDTPLGQASTPPRRPTPGRTLAAKRTAPPHDADGVIIESPDAPLSGARIAPSIPTGDAAGASGSGNGESPEDAADAEAAGMSRLAPAPRPAVGMSAPAASISTGDPRDDPGPMPEFLRRRRL